jgi:hypothetical protein
MKHIETTNKNFTESKHCNLKGTQQIFFLQLNQIVAFPHFYIDTLGNDSRYSRSSGTSFR